jgi:hypothetical protein
MTDSDLPWVADQIMDIQAPEALGMLKRQIDGLLDPAAGRGRGRALRGD